MSDRIEDEIEEMFNEYSSEPCEFISDGYYEFWIYRVLANRVGGKKPPAE